MLKSMFRKTSSEDTLREPFIKSSDGEEWAEESQIKRKQPSTRTRLSAILIHVIIALVYLALITGTTWFWRSDKVHPQGKEVYFAAEEAVEPEYAYFPLRDFYHGNPFVGDPRPEHDAAWGDLLKNMNVRFTEEEMRKMNLTSLALKDGSGYVGSFYAYHEIHCVHWVRKWMHREHYWPYLEGDALAERKVHIEHCLENLRLSAMCRGNRAVSTFEWFGSQPRPSEAEQPHQCINWEKFDSWNAERRVDLFDLDSFEGRPEAPPAEEPDVDVRLGTKPAETTAML